MTIATYKWTIEDYHQAINAGLFIDKPIELLRGELVLMAPEKQPHVYYTRKTSDYLRQILGTSVEISEAHPITLPNSSEPEPDIAIIQPLDEEYLQHHPYPENIFWLIECSKATLRKDLTTKKEIYAEAGIREYWILDLENHQLIVFRDLLNQIYQTELTLTTGSISPISFPDLEIPVSDLLRTSSKKTS